MRPKPHNHHPLPPHARTVYQGRRWSIHEWEQELFDGSVGIFESISRSDAVIVFPVFDDDKLVILEEEQPHWGRISDSIVAGGVEDDEDVFDAAQRELLEETGMVFKDWYLVHAEQRSIDTHSNFYIFVAKNHLENKDKKLDAGERTHPKIISFDELIGMTRERKFFHKKYFVDEYIVRDKIDELFDLLRNPEKYSIV